MNFHSKDAWAVGFFNDLESIFRFPTVEKHNCGFLLISVHCISIGNVRINCQMRQK